MKISISSLLLFLSVLSSQRLHGQTSDTANYFPLTIGNSYVRYESSTAPPLPSNPTVFAGDLTLRDAFQINGKKYFYFPGLYYGSDTVSAPILARVYYLYQGIEQLYYDFAAAVGQSWQITLPLTPSRSLPFLVTLVSRTDTVEVTAGRFRNCLRFQFQGIGSSLEYTDWLAPNVGLVFHGSQIPWELHEALVSGVKYPGMTNVEEQTTISKFALSQNYPNPFNPETIIEYKISTRSPLCIVVFDAVGREVIKLVDMVQPAGTYSLKWSGKDKYGQSVSSGTYFYRLVVGGTHQTRKLLLIK